MKIGKAKPSEYSIWVSTSRDGVVRSFRENGWDDLIIECNPWGGRHLSYEETLLELKILKTEFYAGDFNPYCIGKPLNVAEDDWLKVICIPLDNFHKPFGFDTRRGADLELFSLKQDEFYAPFNGEEE